MSAFDETIYWRERVTALETAIRRVLDQMPGMNRDLLYSRVESQLRAALLERPPLPAYRPTDEDEYWAGGRFRD